MWIQRIPGVVEERRDEEGEGDDGVERGQDVWLTWGARRNRCSPAVHAARSGRCRRLGRRGVRLGARRRRERRR